MRGLACYIDQMTGFEKEYMTSWDGDESTERGTAAFHNRKKRSPGTSAASPRLASLYS